MIGQHWAPVMMVSAIDGLYAITIPEMEEILALGFQTVNIQATVVTAMMQTTFANDCGFQTIGWIAEQVKHQVIGSSNHQCQRCHLSRQSR